jgi:hypothetical protein
VGLLDRRHPSARGQKQDERCYAEPSPYTRRLTPDNNLLLHRSARMLPPDYSRLIMKKIEGTWIGVNRGKYPGVTRWATSTLSPPRASRRRSARSSSARPPRRETPSGNHAPPGRRRRRKRRGSAPAPVVSTTAATVGAFTGASPVFLPRRSDENGTARRQLACQPAVERDAVHAVEAAQHSAEDEAPPGQSFGRYWGRIRGR